MARDAAMDLEGSGPTAGLLRPPQAASVIAQERIVPGRPSPLFSIGTLALVTASLVLSFLLADRGGANAAEQQAAGLPLWGSLGLGAARAWAAAGQALVVAGVALAGRRLAHSEVAGLLAATLVVVDPAGLLLGSLAVPQTIAVAGLLWALTLALSPVPGLHWLAGLALAAATFVVPVAAFWIPPLILLLLLRGHIYAAPQHLALALGQLAVLPGLALTARATLEGGLRVFPACLAVSPLSALTLRDLVQPGADLVVVPDPVVWLGGAGALAFLGLGGVAFTIARFRIARAPGRLQARLASPIPPTLGRASWLLLFVVLAPPVAWLPLFALALALGVRELGEDAPGFGLAIAAVLLAFAGLVLWRSWDAVAGNPGGAADALALVPWAVPVQC